MASFDPPVVLALLVAAQPTSSRAKFEKEWISSVNTRVQNWLKHRLTQSKYEPQLRWEANVVEYVTFLKNETKPKTGKTSTTGPQKLKPGIPIYGPQFFPPSLIDTRLRAEKIKPDTAYLRPINIIHPVYYPTLKKCPESECGSTDVRWDSWTATGSREVHGLKREETALGYQLRHDECPGGSATSETKNRSFATTNHAFWKNWEHWEVPRGFRTFSAVVLLSSTSGGLAEHMKQLHLLEYHEHVMEYLQAYQAAYAMPGYLSFFQTTMTPFSPPNSLGYNDSSITDDLIRDVYTAFVDGTRAKESCICLSVDNTFKAAGKATVVNTSKARTRPMKGGILSVLNELNEIVAWRFCQSASPAEMYEVLVGLKNRCNELGVPFPDMLVSDNCCQIDKEVRRALPDIQICLDVFHFMMRYLAAIINGMSNPHRGEVAADIRNAILKNSASKGVLAKHWSKEEQESKMRAVYVHAAQLKHLQKGCLSRRNQDIASDGSRIESSHKGWNGLQRASASGLELQNALCHDFVRRRNIRMAFSKKPGAPGNYIFVCSTFGSHHTRLVNRTALLFNNILQFEAAKKSSGVPETSLQPVLRNVSSGERFGLVVSQHNDTFGGLLTIKSEVEEEDKLFQQILETPTDPQAVLLDLKIDTALLFQPQQREIPQLRLPSTPDVEIVNTPTQHLAVSSRAALKGTVQPEQDVELVPAAITSTKRKEPDTPDLDPELKELVPIPHAKKTRLNNATLITLDSSTTSKHLYPMFNSADTPLNPAPQLTNQSTPQTSIDLSHLAQPLPLPPHTDAAILKLTRSQRLFFSGTGTNPKALEIAQGSEFFLFMEMRAELKWKASDMTTRKWADAVGRYNERLAAKIPGAIAKTPRALVNKLGAISQRILLNRKIAVCTRCNKVMYPGPPKSPENHKKGYCSDGFKQKPAALDAAPWPQPAVIFSTGSEFHPLPLLEAVRDVYEKLVVEADPQGLTIEHEAFATMLKGRCMQVGDTVLFKLFTGYDIPVDDKTPETLFVEHDGARYLRIDALSNAVPIS
ncbi:hypothetical protein C8R47DRAFT_1256076 [Mycena vitilis]|nr:hypothetical protein C8R47DRAFT_1256076 [Mycena vitilis]